MNQEHLLRSSQHAEHPNGSQHQINDGRNQIEHGKRQAADCQIMATFADLSDLKRETRIKQSTNELNCRNTMLNSKAMAKSPQSHQTTIQKQGQTTQSQFKNQAKQHENDIQKPIPKATRKIQLEANRKIQLKGKFKDADAKTQFKCQSKAIYLQIKGDRDGIFVDKKERKEARRSVSHAHDIGQRALPRVRNEHIATRLGAFEPHCFVHKFTGVHRRRFYDKTKRVFARLPTFFLERKEKEKKEEK